MDRGFALIALMFLAGCGQAPGNSPTPPDHNPPTGSLINKTISASRTYSPNTFTDKDFGLNSGVYTLPEKFDVGTGNAGQGYVSVLFNGVKYCYEGISANPTQVSYEFDYVGAADDETLDCNGQAFTLVSREVDLYPDPGMVTVSVEGGHCDGQCADTDVSGLLTGREY